MIKKAKFDPGLGIGLLDKSKRILNKNGTFNIKLKGNSIHIFHWLKNVNRIKLTIAMVTVFVIINFAYTIVYLIIGVEYLGGIDLDNSFWKCFFFSMQTFTTLGYGSIFPNAPISNFVSGMEAMNGLLFFALATGIVYSRFSKPTSGIKFSEFGVVAPYKNKNAIMFKLVNTISNVLIDLEVRIILMMLISEQDQVARQYFTLTLETPKILFFPLPWTLVHIIDDDSPLKHFDEKQLEKLGAEFLILVKGYDETYGQQIHHTTSFKYNEIKWGAIYKRNYYLNENEEIEMDIDLLDEMIEVELNQID